MGGRRMFFKQAGMAAAAIGMADRASAKVEKSEDGYSMGRAGLEPLPAEKRSFKRKAPLFCPYHSLSSAGEKGGGSHYFRSEAFVHNPFTIPASGMSGSPVIVDAEGRFVGFLTTLGFEQSLFSFDGRQTLTVTVPEGQELFVDESGDGDRAWKKYNAEMMRRMDVQPYGKVPGFWSDVEYCTWVEQKMQSKVRQGHFKTLSHGFLEAYMDNIVELGYPKGKLTLDHGWGLFPDGSVDSGFGSWVPDPETFPDFAGTMAMIRDKGFTPGLWIGFPKVHAASLIAQRYPEIVGSGQAGMVSDKRKDIRWLNPKADLFGYASEVIGRFHGMGVRKFKIDMSYNTKSDMLHIHKELYRAAKSIDPEIEMEFHVPDIFFTRFADTTRTNDIWLNDEYDWPGRVEAHYTVTCKSMPGRCINLDHIGGNDTAVITEEKFLKHLGMYKGKTGYPLVSVLPHHFGRKCVEATGEYLWEYANGSRKVVSDFYA